MPSAHLLTGAVLLPVLVLAAAVDVRTRRIPNRLTAGAALALMVVWAVGAPHRLPGALGWATAAGVALGVPALAAPGALGLGDAKLAFVLGAALGPAVVPALLAGFLAAGVEAAVIVARQGVAAGRRATLALAPHLALGGALAWALAGP